VPVKLIQLEGKHIDRSWENELERVGTYCQKQEKMEEICRQPMFLIEQRTFIIIIIIIIISCRRFSFFPGTSPLEPVVNPTTQASSLSL
jgi:hypothetical protein